MAGLAEFLVDVLQHNQLRQSDVIHALQERGHTLKKWQLSRWLSGQHQPSPQFLPILADFPRAFAMTPAQSVEFHRLLNQQFSSLHPPTTLQIRQHFLGEAALLIGRDETQTHLSQQLLQRRGVVLWGPGGVGKTCLATQLAHQLARHFRHGTEAWALTAGQSAADVLATVADRLGFGVTPALFRPDTLYMTLADLQHRCRDFDLLFHLDNVDLDTQVLDVVRSLPHITWLITSRNALNLPGVSQYSLRPLPPAAAAQLLLRETHTADTQAAGAVTRLLGGLPALIKAAGQWLAQTDGADLHTLAAMLDGQHPVSAELSDAKAGAFLDHLLAHQSPAFLSLLEICGAFPTPRMNRAAIEGIARMDPESLPYLPQLDQLILLQVDDNQVQLHPLAHQYAQARFASSPHRPLVARNFAEYYVRVARQVRQARDRTTWGRLKADFLAAFEYARETETWALVHEYWSPLTYHLWADSDWERYLQIELHCLRAAQVLGRVERQGNILAEIGWVSMEEEHYTEARERLLEARALANTHQLHRLEIRAGYYLGMLALRQRDWSGAETEWNTAEYRIDHVATEPYTLRLRGQIAEGRAWLALRIGQFATARQQAEYALSQLRQAGSPDLVIMAQHCLAEIAWAQGQAAEATTLLQEVVLFGPSTQVESITLAKAYLRLCAAAVARRTYDSAAGYAEAAQTLLRETSQAAWYTQAMRLTQILKAFDASQHDTVRALLDALPPM